MLKQFTFSIRKPEFQKKFWLSYLFGNFRSLHFNLNFLLKREDINGNTDNNN